MPALIAAGGACGLVSVPVNALELGELQVNSALGQPLRASIAYALNPTEELYSYCIYLRPGASGSGIPAIGDARISITDNAILLTGKSIVREPMLSMQIAVDCAYAPHLLREYTVMIDPTAPIVATPPVVASVPIAETALQAQSVANETRPATTRTNRTSAARTPADQSPIAMNASYRAQPGDTVSTIASRIDDRPVDLWSAVDIVFAANPDSFIDQDMNRLMAGSEIFIPDLTENVAAVAEIATTSPVTDIGESNAVADFVGDFSVADADALAEVQPLAEASTNPVIEELKETLVVPDSPASITEDTAAVSEQASELRPGDVVMPPVPSGSMEVFSADSAIENQAVTVPVINGTTSENAGTIGALNWLLWLGGTGAALILGLLLFGRAFRERFGSIGTGSAESPAARRDDDQAQKPPAFRDVDFEFEDTISAQAISLDADLEAGTGLNTSCEIDVAEDFGFSASGQAQNDLDMEITEEAAREPEASPTDVIAPNHREESPSILEKEEPPTDEDGEEYDLSMIVDATKQRIGDYDATAQDLQAVQLDATDATDDDSDYTLTSAVDCDVLEQDYQEEFTATQVLNAEIEQAAKDLANRMEEDASGDITAEMPIAQSTTTDVGNIDQTGEMPFPEITREMPAIESVDEPSDDLRAESDSDITAELTANLSTSVDAENDPVAHGDDPNATVEMTAAGSDITAELQVESGKVDTKKK